MRVPTLLFDLNGTLTDPAALGAPWGLPELGEEVLAAAIQSAMAETLFGAYHEFSAHVESALRLVASRRGLDPAHLDEALEQAKQLPPFTEVPPALERLAAGKARLAVLTNSGADAGRRTLAAAGLDGHFEAILGVDAVRLFKPHPDAYAHALAELGAPDPETVTMVAAHGWDVSGAKHAGMRTAFVDRVAEDVPAVFPRPDLIVSDLGELAERLFSERP